MIMKKTLYMIAAALLALTACTKEMPWDNGAAYEEPDSVYPEGATMDLFFSVPAPAATKGVMADDPDIDNLYVAVFDGAGTLKEYVKAIPIDRTTGGDYIYVDKNGPTNARLFKARVMMKNAERHLHFIANGPTKEEVDASGGTESSLSQQWMTKYDTQKGWQAAYWQRIVLPNGISAYTFSARKPNGTPWAAGDEVKYYYLNDPDESGTYIPVSSDYPGALCATLTIQMANGRPYYEDGNSLYVNPGDFVNAKGDKIVDGTGYFQSEEVSGAVKLVPMVRNFARIRVYPEQLKPGQTSEANFVPKYFYLMNVPDRGTVVPYSARVGGFVPEFTTSSSFVGGKLVVTDPMITGDHDDLMTSLNASRYAAAMPAGTTLIHTVDEVKANNNQIPTSWDRISVDGEGSAFLFERGLPTRDQAPTYLLVGGKLDGFTKDRWFKVELSDAAGKYFRVFRGVTYALEISKIVGSDGEDSPEKAALGPVVSDVSNSIATENLNLISDGNGTSLWVEYIDYVGTKAEGEQKRILYKIFDGNGPLTPTWDHDDDPDTEPAPRYELSVSPEASETTSGAITEIVGDAAYSGTDTPDGKGGWRIATVTLRKTSTAEDYESNLTVAAYTNLGKIMSRKVRYHVMSTRKQALKVKKKLESEAAGEETILTITLPKGLPYSMFPLILEIEAEQGNLNPVPSKNKYPRDDSAIDLPVETGPSYFPVISESSYLPGKNSFHFVFTIQYSDYFDRNKAQDPPYYTDFNLYFSTTRTGSNTTWISVTDRAPRYFFYRPDSPADFYTAANIAITKVTVGQ